MDTKKICSQLENSLIDLKRRKGNLTLDDVCTDTINNACLCILRERQNGNYDETLEENIKIEYLASANVLFPDFNKNYIEFADNGITQNLEWNDMWNFLKQYFREKHDLSIDNVRSNVVVFTFKKQTRYENNQLTATSNDLREVTIEYLGFANSKILISIKPNINLKSANLTGGVAGISIYLCEDNDYKFEIHEKKEIEKVVARRTDRDLKIVYEKS